MTTEEDDAAFFKSWRTAVTLAGTRDQYFGDGTHSPATATSKHDLTPNLERINRAITNGALSTGDAIFLAALVSFYDGPAGAEMLTRADGLGLSYIAGQLDQPRRQVLADLLTSYPAIAPLRGKTSW